MIGPNLSEWGLKRPSLVIFMMIVAVIAGVLSFLRLGRGEDPAITIRTMVVAAAWPGATVEETLKQVTERLERTLQETDHLRTVRSYTTAGQTTIFVDLEQSAPPADIPDVWYQVRKNIGDMRGTLPQGVVGPFMNDDFGDTFGIIYAFTADGFTFRELRDYVESARSRLLGVKDVSKIDVLGAQDEQVFIEFSTEKLAGLRLDYPTIVATLQAQNMVRPAGVIQTDRERVFLRVTGAFETERDIENVNFVAGDRIVRLGDIATVRRGFVDPPQPMFRVNGKPAIGLAIAMRDAGDILALGKNVRNLVADIKADLPLGIEPVLVADQAVSVDVAIGDFMTSLWQAIVIILVCSFLSLGVRPGAVVALAIPLTLAIVFAVMDVTHTGLHRISLGALIIALALLVDDAMTTVDAMIRRLGAGDSKDEAATFAYRTLAAPMLIGTLVTIASFVPIGFAQSSAGEYTFSIFSVVAIALLASWLVAVLFAPLVGKAILQPPKAGGEEKPSRIIAAYSAFLSAAIRARWITIAVTLAAFAAAVYLSQHVPRQFFPASDRSELTVNLTLRQNASIHATEAEAKRLEAILSADPDVDHYSTYVGRGAIRFILHPRRPARESVLRAVRDRRQGSRGARAPAAEAGKGAGRAVSGRGGARVSARTRAAGGVAAAIPDPRARTRTRCAGFALEFAADPRLRPADAARPLRLDGAGAAGACATSTRTRRAGWASVRARSPRCSTRRSPASPSRSCATTSTSSTSSRARPTTSGCRSRR